MGGGYSCKIVSIIPNDKCPIIILNLLYRACLPGTIPNKTSCTDLYQVSIALLPNPNNRQSLALVPAFDNQYNDGRVTIDGICKGISVFHLKENNNCDEETTECLIICGGNVGSCDPKDGLDFLSFLCNRFDFDFSVRRDRRGKLWLISNAWTEESFPSDHVEVLNESNNKYYIDYERLRRFFEKKSCFKFDDCDPAQLAALTRCYEIWIICQDGQLAFVYTAKQYRRLDRCFKEIVETCNFDCFPTDGQTPTVRTPTYDMGQICVGNYNCVRKLYCCSLDKKGVDCDDKKDKCSKYSACCREHAHEHHHKKKCGSNGKCKCGYNKKYHCDDQSDSSHDSDHDYDESKCSESDGFVAHASCKL